MKKRLVALFLLICLLCVSTCALAAQTRAAGVLSGGLNSNGGNSYQLYGKIRGTSGDYKTVRAELYLGSSIIASTPKETGTSSIVTATTNITLSPGTYTVYVYGTTSTEPSLFTSKNVTIP